jgi:DNA relaxase NicK
MGKESREKNKRIGKEEVWWRYSKGECKEQEDAIVPIYILIRNRTYLPIYKYHQIGTIKKSAVDCTKGIDCRNAVVVQQYSYFKYEV